MTSYLDKVRQSSEMSRRNFLKASAAATAALAAGGLAGCSNTVEPVEGEVSAPEEKWVTAACWHNCGGRCLNKVLVKGGVVVRQKTDDTHEDSPEYPQLRACVRGHSQRKQILGIDRLKYPMKRKGWSPDAPNGDMRGRDEWERIGWDEALDYVAAELTKAYDTYGPQSVLTFSDYGHAVTGLVRSTLFARGGASVYWDTSSLGTYYFDWSKIGLAKWDLQSVNDRFDLCNAETIVMQGVNPAWSSSAFSMYACIQAKKAGAKFVYIGPYNNASAQTLDARWIPVHSGTDVAFMLAVAYVLFSEDDPQANPLIDWEFLDKYTVGYDADHLPADAKLQENFKDYVLGEYDGIPKTPEWAATISGASTEDIHDYAYLIAKGNKVTLLHGNAPARCKGAEDFPQMFLTLGLMTGHMGKPGEACGEAYKTQVNTGKTLVKAGATGLPTIKNPVDDAINSTQCWKSIISGTYQLASDATGWENKGERPCDIHVIHVENRASIQTQPAARYGIDAFRHVDFVFTQAFNFNTAAKLSDIVLPVTTAWEIDGGAISSNADRESIIYFSKVIDPLFEAKTDQWIAEELATRLGLDAKEIFPYSVKEQFFNSIATSQVWDPELGDYAPLASITEDDLAQWGVEGETQEGVIPINELVERGAYQYERSIDDDLRSFGHGEFLADPEANPKETPTGKFEIYSDWKADRLNQLPYSDLIFKPYPSYTVSCECYETTFSDWDAQQKGEYPFVLYNPHYLRRTHSSLDQVELLQEAWTAPVFLNSSDAAAKGVADGDTVIITNAHASVLRVASLTESMMPGQVGLPHGAWLDWDEDAQLCRAGHDNVLCGPVTSNLGVSGYNNYNCNFEKYTGEPLIPDYEKPRYLPGIE